MLIFSGFVLSLLSISVYCFLDNYNESLFEFQSFCEKAATGQFQVHIAGFEESCGHFSANGTLDQIKVKFEVFAMDIVDMDVDLTGLLYIYLHYYLANFPVIGQHFQVVVFSPGVTEGLRFGDADQVVKDGEGPYQLNTFFIPWDESEIVDGVNFRAVYVPEGHKLVGSNSYKVCIFSISYICIVC